MFMDDDDMTIKKDFAHFARNFAFVDQKIDASGHDGACYMVNAEWYVCRCLDLKI